MERYAGGGGGGLLDLGALLFLLFIFLFVEFRWPSLPLQIKKWVHISATGKRVTKEKRRTIEDIPGPPALPLLGTRWVYSTRYRLSRVHEAYADMFKRYGDVLKEEGLGNVRVVSVRSRASVEKVLASGGKYPLRPPTDVTAHYRASRPDRYTNLGIINEQGEKWWTLRSGLTSELTSGRTVGRLFPELASLAEEFAQLLSKRAATASQPLLHFERLAHRLGLESTCRIVLGRRLGFLEGGEGLASRLAAAVGEQFKASRDAAYGLPFWKIFPTPSYNKFMHSEDTIYDIISEMVEEAVLEEEESCQVEEGRRVFASILQAPGLDLRDKKAAIIDFIAAGIRTMGNSLVFALYMLAKNPRCQEKLYEEIVSLSEGEAFTPLSLKSSTYLKACLYEGFRMLPTAPWLARILDCEMELDGYHLKPGSVVLCHTWSTCMDESNFPRATTYEPERWLGTASGRGAGALGLVSPFGAGRRLCPGKKFVETQLQLIIAELVRRFEIHFDGELDLEFEFLLAPKPPVNSFRFRPRT